MKLIKDEKVVLNAGTAIMSRVGCYHDYINLFDFIYLTNKRIIQTRLFFFERISIPLVSIKSVEKAAIAVGDDSVIVTYQEKENLRKQRIIFSQVPLFGVWFFGKKKRDRFYNALKNLIPQKVE